jgi:uncharacterized membrane protein YjdF
MLRKLNSERGRYLKEKVKMVEIERTHVQPGECKVEKTGAASRIENRAKWRDSSLSDSGEKYGGVAIGRRISPHVKESFFAEFLRGLILAALFIAASAFLLNLAYLGVFVATGICGALLLAFYAYIHWRRRVKLPIIHILLMLGAVEVDTLGNYFHLYGRPFGPMQYDEFSHMLCSALVAPVVMWLLQTATERGDYRLPLSLVAVIAVAMIFSFCGFYEIIELWDERYFHGKRIWGPYDTSNDLQWDLIGAVAGAALAYAALRLKGWLAGFNEEPAPIWWNS